MAESEKRMDKLAERAKEAANRVHASTTKTKEKLESQVAEARTASDKTKQELKAKAAETRNEATQDWDAIRQEWHDHIAKIQAKVDASKQERRIDRAEHRATRAEDDALAAIDFAYLAIEDAEWAVLDAHLARVEADELVAAHARAAGPDWLLRKEGFVDMEHPDAHQPVSRLPREPNPALRENAQKRAQSVENRVADRITAFAGSMPFVYLHVFWFAGWIALGVEKYPFGLLTMIVSLEAIFLSTFVLISQNRTDAKRQVLADQQWQTVQDEDRQNQELLDLSKQILELTREVHAYAAASSERASLHADRP